MPDIRSNTRNAVVLKRFAVLKMQSSFSLVFGVREIWISVPTPLLTSCVTLSKTPSLILSFLESKIGIVVCMSHKAVMRIK